MWDWGDVLTFDRVCGVQVTEDISRERERERVQSRDI